MLLYPLTPESPRWLLSVNKEKEALKIINQISRLHKKAAPNEQKLDDKDTKQQTDTTLTTGRGACYFDQGGLHRRRIFQLIVSLIRTYVLQG